MTCTVDDCEREAVARGLCWGHYKRAQRGRRVSGPLRHWGKPGTALNEAALAMANAETNEDFVRFRERLRGAVRNLAGRIAPIRRK